MGKKPCLSSEINSILNVKSIQFTVYYIFFGFWTRFFQIEDTVCNARRDPTIACYSSPELKASF